MVSLAGLVPPMRHRFVFVNEREHPAKTDSQAAFGPGPFTL
jgi:hypothetical protein